MSIVSNMLERVGLVRTGDVKRYIKSALIDTGGTSTVDIFGGQITDKDYKDLIKQYKSWVYTCVDKISKTVASLPLSLYTYQKEGKYINGINIKQHIKNNVRPGEAGLYLKQQNIRRVKVESHPLYELFDRPNKLQTRSTLWIDTMIKLELTGKVGWYIPRNGLQLPGEIWALPLYKEYDLTPIPDAKEVIRGYKYTNGQNTTIFDTDEIIYFKYPNPESPFKSTSPLVAQSYPYDIENYLMEQQYELYKRKALPGLVFSTDKVISKDKKDEIIDHINQTYKGASRSGKPMVLHGGMKVDKPVTMNAKELMIEEISQFTQDKLLSGFGVPAGKLGLVKDVNRANMEALDKTFYQETIKPRCMMIEEYLESYLLPMYDERLTTDFELPVNEDKELNIKERESNLKVGLTTINEERNKVGLDEVDWGERPWLPFNVLQPGQKKDVEEPEGGGDEKSAEYEDKAHAGAHARDLDDIIWKQFVNSQEELEIPIREAMKDYFRNLKSEVIARYDKLSDRKAGHLNGWSRKKRDEWVKKGNLEDINIDMAAEVKALKELAEPYVREIMLTAGQNRLNELSTIKQQTEFTFAILPDSEAEKWLGDRLDMFSKEVADTTFDDIDKILKKGFAAGESTTVIGETLAEKFASYEKSRAQAIATTETVAAMSRADLIAVKGSGVADELEKYWIDSRDSHVRDTHKTAGQVYSRDNAISLDEDFKVGEDSMPAPGNGSIAKENIRCRCTIGYLKKGE